MELYQFLFALIIIYYLNFYYFFLLIFSFLMLRHFYKKKIINYEIDDKNKKLVYYFKFPIYMYDKLKSYKYDNILFNSLGYIYKKINLFYNTVLDEIFLMFSDLFYDIMNKNIKNNSNYKFLCENILDNMVCKLSDQNNKISINNDSILDKIKKINNSKNEYDEKLLNTNLDKILEDEMDNFFKNEKELKESLNNLALKFNSKKNL